MMPSVKLKGRVGGVVGGGGVRLALLVVAGGNVRRAQALDGLHFAEQIVEHVAPVAEHVDDDAAAVLGAVVPDGRCAGCQSPSNTQ